MTYSKVLPVALGGLALAAAAALFAPGVGIIAADHLDPPSRTDPAVDSTPDRAADIERFLEREVWSQIPDQDLGKAPSAEEIERILGLGVEGH